MRTLNIGLESWIIQDGNYPDFEVGNEYRFALQCYMQNLEPAREPIRLLDLINRSDYQFSGQVVLADEELTVMDAGVMCYQEGTIGPDGKSGEWLSGQLYLGVDPFFWFERHAMRADVPELRYSWLLHKILLGTTPWEESTDDHGRKVERRANVATAYQSVLRTNAWEDDRGYGHYVLECELLED